MTDTPSGSELVAEVEAFVAAASAENAKDDAQIAALQADNATLAADDAADAEQIAALQTQVSEKNAVIATKDAEIAALTAPVPGTVNIGQIARVKAIVSGGTVTSYEITSPDGSVETVPAPASGDLEMRLIGTIAMAQMMAAGGGGGTPEWVPEGAFAYASFKNAQYYANGAETTYAGIISESDFGNFTEGQVTAGVGIAGTGTARPSFNPAIYGDLMTEGVTVVMEFAVGEEEPDLPNILQLVMVELPDYTQLSYIAVWHRYLQAQHQPPLGWLALDDYGGPASPGFHKVALTMIPGVKTSASIDGRAFGTAAWPEGADESVLTHLAMTVSYTRNVLEAVTLYPPRPDADLPALSALS